MAEPGVIHSSLMMRNTLSSGCPAASRSVHQVKDSATAFRKVTRPSASVVITTSLIL